MPKLSFLKKRIGSSLINHSESLYENTFFDENKFTEMFANHPDAVFVLDVNRKVQIVNQSIQRIFGYGVQELRGNLEKIYERSNRGIGKQYFQKALNGKAQNFQAVVYHKNGRLIHVDITYVPILADNTEVIGVYGIAKDITVHVEREKEVNKIKNSLELAQQIGSIGSWDYDIVEGEIYWSKQMFDICGLDFHHDSTLSLEEALQYIHPEDRQTYKNAINRSIKTSESYSIDYRILKRDGTFIYVSGLTEIILDENKKPIRLVGIIQDITAKIVTEEKLNEINKAVQHIAYHDYLTDLPNRIFFENKIESLIKQSSRSKAAFSIMYLGLDRFRHINESLGHLIGDQLLQQLSKRVNALLNDSSLLARMEGDEFGIIIWDYTQNEYPITLAKVIIDCLNKPFMVEDFELYLTASIGISSYPVNGKTVEEISKNTHAALYRAKANGKNNYQIYSSSLNINAFKQFYLERDLRKSIINDELLLHFQPRVSPSTGKLISAEALVRWEHPVWGIVSPNEFIPLAEETGFINDIGDWVLQQVCTFIKAWKQADLPIVPISINISAQRFLKNDWKFNFIKRLEETDTDPSLIELEITETTLIKYEKEVIAAFQFLKEFGIKIALDDFGTGYTSFSYIKDFSFDTIKIDKSFIRQIAHEHNAEIIIKSLIFMAKGLNMNVVAEGVETNEQLTFLKQQECKEVQGYIFSKPISDKQFQVILRKRILKPIFNSDKQIDLTDRRSYYRINLVYPLCSDMALTSIQGKQVQLGKTNVLIEDIGPGGLRFLSTIHLPIRPDVTFEFETLILGQTLKLKGHIVWKDELKGVFQYGLKFSIDEHERDCIVKILNNFSLHLRSHSIVPNCSFMEEDRFTYLKRMNSNE
ncbi:EAL domain-containing protein [Bacillus sp. PS06]|uniref:EAL domain-containing protein n=1 Tax=Bacillus sp. PS06 TaxID=2764176 RepID=UPI00178378E9|nr:EAL domain-containing protein [Bacillus sp. PS06]MBD8067392.1 EAL domain-containing protein [Bacillus sp. PS06]